MEKPALLLTPEERQAFLTSAAKVRQAAERHLAAHRSRESVVAFVSNLQRGISRVVQTAAEQGAGIACQAGCSHCCNARVEAMPPEVFRIAAELARRPAEELDLVVRRLTAHAAANGAAAAWNRRTPCAFLVGGLCSIYDVRPGVCRKAHSLDAARCRANAAEIPQDLGTVVATEALAKGTSEAYGTLGFDGRGYELGRAVLLALADPSAESRWFSGEAVFAPEPVL